MKIHGNDVVGTSNGQHVGDQLCGDGGTGLVLLVLTSVGEAGDDGSNAASRGGLASVDHDEELHEVVVDLSASGLDNVDILVTDGLSDGDRGLLVRVLEHNSLGKLGSETAIYHAVTQKHVQYWLVLQLFCTYPDEGLELNPSE